MGSQSRHARSNLYDVPVALRHSRSIAELTGLATQDTQTAPIQLPVELAPKGLKRRARIWELNSNLHCSIIGTCLSAPELRRLLMRLNIPSAEAADEHDLHMLGVLLAGRPLEGAKLLQKTLDRRHQLALNQFARAKDDAGIAALWDKAVSAGDIPGAYWAVLTHASSSDKLVQKVFGDVHMLSHLMGATNCADLRRMHRLENEVVELNAKLERQQHHLRVGFTERDETIGRLNRMLAEKISADAERPADREHAELATLKDAVADLGRRLARETSLRERLENRLKSSDEAEQARRRVDQERDALQQELDLIEGQLGVLLRDRDESEPAGFNLEGMTVLYVGGRARQVPQLKALLKHAGGELIHHDGGIEHATGLLPGLVSRSDLTLFPVDCVSHNAMAAVKRACQQLGKPYLALRTSSLACLLSALAGMRRQAGIQNPHSELALPGG